MSTGTSLLVFSLEALRLGFPLEAVERVVTACELTPLPGAPGPVAGAINLHGDLVPVLELRPRLGLAAREVCQFDHFLVVRIGERRFALLIGDTEGVVEFPTEALVPSGEVVEGLAHIRGAIRLPDGLLLVTDPDRFLDLDEMRALARALAAAAVDSNA
ncbi:MAG: chemotaxis protein CheW [Proteobacteria bacterium]|nr:chemotaxis protein CheW [Pseudomonadota bacterium]